MIEPFSLALTVEVLQGKTCQDTLLSGEGRSLGAKISGDGVVPGEYFFGFYKTSYLTVQTASCYMPSFWHNNGVWQTDRQTDGVAVASTALAMRRAVKTRASETAGRYQIFHKVVQWQVSGVAGSLPTTLFTGLLPCLRTTEFWTSVDIRRSYGRVWWHLFGVQTQLLVFLRNLVVCQSTLWLPKVDSWPHNTQNRKHHNILFIFYV